MAIPTLPIAVQEQAKQAVQIGKPEIPANERPEYQKQIHEIGLQQLIRRQVRDADDKLLAELVVMSGAAFRGDLPIALIDPEVRLHFDKDGVRAEGKPGMKFVDIDVKTGEIKPVEVLLSAKEMQYNNKSLEGIFLHTPAKGANITVSGGVPVDEVELTTGSATIESDLMVRRPENAVPLRLAFLDKNAKYDVRVKNLMHEGNEITEGFGKARDVLDQLKKNVESKGYQFTAHDTQNQLELGVLNGANTLRVTFSGPLGRNETADVYKAGKKVGSAADLDQAFDKAQDAPPAALQLPSPLPVAGRGR